MSLERVTDVGCFHVATPYARGEYDCCRLQIFVDASAEEPPLIVATQDSPPHRGGSLTNNAEHFATAAWGQFFPDMALPPRWVEHYATPDDSEWKEVTFTPTDYGIRAESWSPWPGSRDLVDLDHDRGPTCDPEAPEPEIVFDFGFVEARTLPRTRPFRAPECMSRPGSRRRRLWRRIKPLRFGECCWYHRGDWRAVLAELETRIPDTRVSPDDPRLAELLDGLDDSQSWSWSRQALRSVIHDPVQVSSGSWVNGQHRAQAAIDAGAPRVFVMFQRARDDPTIHE